MGRVRSAAWVWMWALAGACGGGQHSPRDDDGGAAAGAAGSTDAEEQGGARDGEGAAGRAHGGSTVGGAASGGTDESSAGSGGGSAADGAVGGAESGGSSGAIDEPSCDDLNPCTRDSVVDGVCEHSPGPDGAACEDGDLCTLGDACRAGVCASGEKSQGSVAALGRVAGFGTQGVVGTGTGRYLFFETGDNGVRFSLLVLDGAVATVLDHRVVPGYSFVDSDFATVPTASLGDGLIAFATSYGEKVLLLDVSGDKIAVASELALPTSVEVPHPASFARQGNRLWICANTFFFGGILFEADVSDPASPKIVQQFSAPSCGSLAASDDGQRLYVNTSGGVYLVDVSQVDVGGSITVGSIIAPNSGLALRGPYLVFREPAQVRVLLEADSSEVFRLPVAARGVSLMGDRLFLQGTRTVASGVEAFLSVYDISSGSPQLLDEVLLATAPSLPSYTVLSGLPLPADPEHVIQLLTKSVYRLEHDKLVEVAVPGLGSLKFVAGDGERAFSLERGRTQAFDVADPSAPTLVRNQSYLFDRGYEATPVLYETLEPEQVHFGFGEGKSSDQVELWGPERITGIDSLVTMRRRALDSDLRKDDRFFQVARETSTWSLEGGSLYRLLAPKRGSTRARFERWAERALPSDGALIGAATDQLTLEPAIVGITPDSYSTAVFDVDARSARAVVAISAKLDGTGPTSFVYALDLSVSPPQVIEHAELRSLVTQLRVAKGRTVLTLAVDVCCDNELAFWEPGSAPRARADRAGLADGLTLLAFDERAVYASGRTLDANDAWRWRLYVVPWDAVAPVETVDTASAPTSLAPTKHGLVVGSQNELLTVRPYCGE